MASTVSGQSEWDALPIGTIARLDTIEFDDDGDEKDIVIFVLRVESEIRVDAGPYMLAGGKYWENAFEWDQGGQVGPIVDLFS